MVWYGFWPFSFEFINVFEDADQKKRWLKIESLMKKDWRATCRASKSWQTRGAHTHTPGDGGGSCKHEGLLKIGEAFLCSLHIFYLNFRVFELCIFLLIAVHLTLKSATVVAMAVWCMWVCVYVSMCSIIIIVGQECVFLRNALHFIYLS